MISSPYVLMSTTLRPDKVETFWWFSDKFLCFNKKKSLRSQPVTVKKVPQISSTFEDITSEAFKRSENYGLCSYLHEKQTFSVVLGKFLSISITKIRSGHRNEGTFYDTTYQFALAGPDRGSENL